MMHCFRVYAPPASACQHSASQCTKSQHLQKDINNANTIMWKRVNWRGHESIVTYIVSLAIGLHCSIENPFLYTVGILQSLPQTEYPGIFNWFTLANTTSRQ
ncbi:hypothetical protein FGO68_gene5210 [Halteria grandinella]|uniref:Uncharacterized protein n=1 Tax=Halteria grandinella TaxID=5974 RepID=A0A8J8NR62_HALGN|nr:hypothetical protein FGO68_gene5210 [Halteria grandinella]